MSQDEARETTLELDDKDIGEELLTEAIEEAATTSSSPPPIPREIQKISRKILSSRMIVAKGSVA